MAGTLNSTGRPIVQLAFAVLGCLSIAGIMRADDTTEHPIVDCHVHLWDLSRPEGIAWLSKVVKVLYRSFLPEFHEPIAKANGVEGVVVVQAGQSLPDNQLNLDITAHNKRLYRGVVGNLSQVIGTEEFRPLFEKLCGDERYVGYRISGRYQEKLADAFFAISISPPRRDARSISS